jgi:transcriptional regulator with XRE-family HTH domain
VTNKHVELKQAINDYCRKTGITKNELSKQTGINVAYFSKIENDKFNDITDKMLTRIGSIINKRTVSELFQTTDLVAVHNQCEKTRKYKLMTGLTADTGMGKTTSLKACSLRENVFMVTVDKTMNARRFLLAVLKELRVSFDGNIHDVMLRFSTS